MATLTTWFEPAQHGFPFSNWFERALGPGGRWRVAYGLCGGMCFAALDYGYAGIPIPTGREAPPKGPLWGYLVRRQLDSLSLPWGALRILWWVLQSDRRLLEWTVNRELPRLRARLAQGEPAVLVLIRKTGLFSLIENHQVVAIALEEAECAGEAVIYLYDPNYPGENRAIVIHKNALSPAEALHDLGGEPIFGFYVVRYRPRHSELPRGE